MLKIETLDNQTAFAPGEPIEGVVSWQLDRSPDGLQVNLVWYTSGRGTRNHEVVQMLRIDDPAPADVRSFSFTAPYGPSSASGRMVSIAWCIELVARRRRTAARLDLVIGPDRREVEARSGASTGETEP
jgi:hypothetical protein